MSEAQQQEAVISIRELNKSFGEKKVLQNLNLDLFRGEQKVVLGKSGSGKSVLIKCIIGLVVPDSGTIDLFGENVTGLEGEDLDQVRAKVGFLFQSNALYDSMTVKENLEFPLRRHRLKITDAEAKDLVMEALNNVGLGETLNQMPSELSGGMRKRIALARTLIMKPEIILYDEPTTGLDPITAKEIAELINMIHDKYQTSSIIISHDMNCIKHTAHNIAMLINGHCYAQGSYAELENSSDNKINSFFQ